MDSATSALPADVNMQYNMRSPAVKRLLREAMEMAEANPDYWAQPLEDNLFEWHFTIKGAPETDFEYGIYHGRIILPPEYPMKPPSIIMLTPNGRFETGVKICLSISSYHPETWRPSWSIRTALVALISFMNTSTPGAIGSLEYPSDARKSLARKSRTFECSTCGLVMDKFKDHKLNAKEPAQVSRGSAEEVFQAPHNPGGEKNPSTGDTNQSGSGLNPPSVDSLTAGNPNLFTSMNSNDEIQESRMYGFAFGAIVCAITGLLFRRLVATAFSWDNMFS